MSNAQKTNSIVIAIILFAVVVSSSRSHGQNVSKQDLRQQQINGAVKALQGLQDLRRVQPGTENEATLYYKRIGAAGVLNFDVLNSSLNSFLEYMGYSTAVTVNGNTTFNGLLAQHLESFDSFVLMPRDAAEFDALAKLTGDPDGFRQVLKLADFQSDNVLVTRFFAPKIATYFDSLDPFEPIPRDDIKPGWRKLVRLKPRALSPADTAGVKQIYLLFNVKKQDPDVDPFLNNESANNQVIIVPKDQTVGDTCYFVVYQSATNGYANGLFLAADFDLPGHVGTTIPGALDGKYFVPRACAECHGHSGGTNDLRGDPVNDNGTPTADFSTGIYKFAKPNYLDTDQWYDWMEFDYRGVTTSLNDVIFDGGKDHGSASYKRGFDVVRSINKDIRDETIAAEPQSGQKTYQTQAAEKWLSLHAVDDQRKPYSLRSIGTGTWDSSSKDEMRLVRLLNNHCFRCHSSLRYNVFDRAEVAKRNEMIKFYLKAAVDDSSGNPLPGFFMPQGRVLPATERDEIISLVNKVFGP